MIRNKILTIFLGIVSIFFELKTAHAYPDAVLCDLESGQKKVYSIDYLLLKNMETNETEEFWENTFDYKVSISTALQLLGFHDLSSSFFSFPLEIRTNINSVGYPFTWIEASFGFEPILIDSLSPQFQNAGCKISDKKGYIAVSKRLLPKSAILEFDPKIILSARNEDLVQYTYLITQLWLSFITDDRNLSRQINFIFHQKDLLKNKKNLENLKLLITQMLSQKIRENSICDKTILLQEGIQNYFGKSCNEITNDDLLKIEDLKIQDIARNIISFDKFDFRRNDFYGLKNLKRLSFAGLMWVGTALKSYSFIDLERLEELDFSNTFFHILTPSVFKGLSNLSKLDLSGHHIELIYPETFSGIFSKDPRTNSELLLSFYSPRSSVIETNLFKGAGNLRSLDLSYSTISKFEQGAMAHLTSLKYLSLSEANREINFNGNLNGQFLKSLEKLILNDDFNGNFFAELIYPFPNLNYLDISGSFYGLFNFSDKFELIKNIQTLILTNTFAPLPAFPENFKKLNKLEHLIARNFTNLADINEAEIGIQNLPKSLKILEICHYLENIDYWKYLLKKLPKNYFTNGPILLRSSDKCKTPWVEEKI